MLERLKSYEIKPPAYTRSESKFWEDSHISKYMLEAHLNSEKDAASRTHRFMDESVQWIKALLPPNEYPKLLDLGCGPGLYCERFWASGYNVTGVDYAKRSIDYARASNSYIQYH